MDLDRFIGSWTQLTDRVLQQGAWRRWQASEPLLASLAEIGELRVVTAPGAEPVRSDAVIAALTRLAAANGGDDVDAVLVVTHLLAAGLGRLIRRLRGLDADLDALAVGELCIQVRAFPWQRRHHAYAASLLLETKSALLRQLLPGSAVGVWRTENRPGRTQVGPVQVEVVDPLNPAAVIALLDRAVPGPGEEPLTVADVVLWAARSGVGRAEDLRVLAQLAAAEDSHGAITLVAAERGEHRKTVRVRRDRALADLQAAAGRYLSEAA